MTTYVAYNVRDTAKTEVGRVDSDGTVISKATPILLANISRFKRDKATLAQVMAANTHLAFEEQGTPPVKKDDLEQSEAVAVAIASGLISKADEEQQIVYGWAYVTHDKDGNVVVDKSGEFVDEITEIEKAATHFMLNSRASDIHHTNVKTSDVVESMVFTPEKCDAIGIAKGTIPSGWWIGVKCDDVAWAAYKAGATSFSIHGSGTRKAVED